MRAGKLLLTGLIGGDGSGGGDLVSNNKIFIPLFGAIDQTYENGTWNEMLWNDVPDLSLGTALTYDSTTGRVTATKAVDVIACAALNFDFSFDGLTRLLFQIATNGSLDDNTSPSFFDDIPNVGAHKRFCGSGVFHLEPTDYLSTWLYSTIDIDNNTLNTPTFFKLIVL